MSNSLDVLILENRADDAELMLYELRRSGFEPHWQRVEEKAAYLARLRPDLDLILADYTLPQFDALQALHLLQSTGLDIPFIVVTGSISEEVAVECIKLGATDYLLKDRLTRLGTAVRQALHEKQLRAEKRQAETALAESQHRLQALFDHSQDSFLLFDDNDRCLAANPAATRLTGFSQEQLSQMRLGDIASRLKRPEGPLASLISAGQQQRGEFELEQRSGEKVIVDYRAAANIVPGVHLLVLRDITDRKRTELQLQASLSEKEVLLREIHHRVKNNLQAVANLIYLQAGYTNDEHVRRMLQNTQDRIKSIALIHEKLYQPEGQALVKFADYVASLVDHLARSHGPRAERVALKLDVVDLPLDMDIAITLGIIINELVSNAFKYAFPESAHGVNEQAREIRIELQQVSNDLVLTVADNGAGIPPDIDISRNSSLGLQLVRTLSGHMRGTVELIRTPGTSFKVILPLPKPRLG